LCRNRRSLRHNSLVFVKGLKKYASILINLVWTKHSLPPEDGNLIAETYVGVTNILYFVNNSCALVGLTKTYDKMHGTYNTKFFNAQQAKLVYNIRNS
jgi:hypothetical protein